MNPTDAQIKEFWKQFDIDIAKFTDGIPLERIEEGRYTAHLIDLNNLFKYAVSRMWICDINLMEGIIWSVKVSCPDVHGWGKHGNGKAIDEDLTLALFWAIYEVINFKVV